MRLGTGIAVASVCALVGVLAILAPQVLFGATVFFGFVLVMLLEALV